MTALNRVKELQKQLVSLGMDVLYTDNLIDIYYITGIPLSLGKLFITPKKVTLVVDARYFEACQKKAACEVVLLDQTGYAAFLKKLLRKQTFVFGFDGASLTFDHLETFKKLLKKHTKGQVKAKNFSAPFQTLRACKDKKELQELKKAADLGSKGFDFVLDNLKVGITEIQIANKLDAFWKDNGGNGLAFDPIIAFGKNASMPHYHPKQVKLKAGDQVLIDIGVKVGPYHSDMTRTVFFKKAPSKKLSEVYEVVREAQELAIKACRSGVTCKELDDIARKHIEKSGYGKYFSHSLGHGVGLEIHEFPALSSASQATLQEGMVVTIEPGIYISSLGGVRIEDTVIVQKNKALDITKRPKALKIVG
jgi:Xaa-Pro aminopeptidase